MCSVRQIIHFKIMVFIVFLQKYVTYNPWKNIQIPNMQYKVLLQALRILLSMQSLHRHLFFYI